MPGYKLAFLAAFLLHSQLSAAFSVTHNDRTRLTSTLAAATADDSFKEQHPNRKVEFGDLEPIAESLARQARAKNDEKNRRSFVKYGEELWSLRKDMHSLSKKLVLAINSGVREKEEEIRVKLREAENRDPELVYKVEVAKLLKATDEGRSSNAERHGRKAMAARSCLPQYNLEGLWVGK